MLRNSTGVGYIFIGQIFFFFFQTWVMIKIIVKHEHFYVIRNETFQLFEMANKVIYKFRLWAWAWCACPPYGPQQTVLYKMLGWNQNYWTRLVNSESKPVSNENVDKTILLQFAVCGHFLSWCFQVRCLLNCLAKVGCSWIWYYFSLRFFKGKVL